MPSYGKTSTRRLETAHPDLQAVFKKAIELTDITILEGSRSKEQQRLNVEKGVSKTMDSRHLDAPHALAIDAAPWFEEAPHVRWPDASQWREEERRMLEMRWLTMVGVILGIGHSMGIPITSGLDWDRDFNFREHKFHDWPHFQLPKGYV